MTEFDILNGKRILAVDDEPDILEIIKEELGSSNCEVITAGDFDTAHNIISRDSFDLIILDIMGVNGFALLEASMKSKIPAAMLTAYALNVENVNLAIKLGAVSFIPKEKLANLGELVAEIFTDIEEGKSHWEKLFKRLGSFFKEKLGDAWDEVEKNAPNTPPYI